MNKTPLLATYRLQLNKDFTFQNAADIVPYLSVLNISHLYLSPVFESSPGSMHGYDVADFSKISEERGGEAGFRSLIAAIQDEKESLNLILDIVPNHMGIAEGNPYWLDVLSKGAESEYWPLFDLRVEEGGKLRLPILDEAVGDAIDHQAIAYAIQSCRVGISIKGRFLPLREETVDRLKSEALAAGCSLDSYLSTQARTHLLDSLGEQHYQLVVWTESFDAIDYRRFFDITDLIGVRVEQDRVYRLSHRYLIDLAGRFPSIQGVRVDHIDGLAEPSSYLHRLHDDFSSIWVEKILGSDETLPAEWPVCGTTGYEFINRMNDLFVNTDGFKELESYWNEKIDERWKDFQECVARSKEQALRTLFSSELKRLVNASCKEEEDREKADLFWSAMTIYMPVYRTYAGKNTFGCEGLDWIEQAAKEARRRLGAAFEEAERIFMPALLSPRTSLEKQAVLEWQQLTGPVMAKGLEDTAHYRYTPLAALNEVGCEPVIRSGGRMDFFRWLDRQLECRPYSLVATSTHDTKRSEDARHRLYTLADRPDLWIEFFEEAVSINNPLKERETSLTRATEYFLYQAIIGIWPFDHEIDGNFTDRICAYMRKSGREARQETNWLNPDPAYEDALERFIRSILAHPPFLRHIERFADPVMKAGVLNSLSVLTLKILSGCVPDIYQGMDLWNFSLVDPDNRRKVDFSARREMQAALKKQDRAALIDRLLDRWQDGGVKLWLTQALLDIRREHLLNLEGRLKISPLTMAGEDRDYVIAYHIGTGFLQDGLIVVCSRFFWKRDFMKKISVQFPDLQRGRKYRDLIFGRSISGGEIDGSLFERFPVGVYGP